MTPEEFFDRMKQQWLGPLGPLADDHLAEDVVIEFPFAAPGRPSRIEGRAEFAAFANPERAALPIQVEGAELRAAHRTTAPDTFIIEYALTATHGVSGRRATANFIAVLTMRDDKIVLWREYQDTAAMGRALAAA
jgi:ketosteroid isomerase-like protein